MMTQRFNRNNHLSEAVFTFPFHTNTSFGAKEEMPYITYYV